ncbi:MAG: hypothetical protein GC161_00705 [Planctomycetaceae bacterium]|nr:hypothetical protein [Planctomycetaceae bacterium]
MQSDTGASSATQSGGIARGAALVGSAWVLAFAYSLLDSLVASRRFPFAGSWSDPLPLVAIFGLVAVVVAARVRRGGAVTERGGAVTERGGAVTERGGAVSLFGGVLGVAAGVHGAADLPPFGANAWFADGPQGAWYLLGAGILTGLFAAAGPRRWRADERLAAVLLVVTTGSANLFSRDGEGIFALLGAGVFVHLLAAPPVGPMARPFARGVLPLTLLSLGFVLWTWLGIANGEDTNLGYRVGLRVVLGWTLLLALGRGLDAAGVRRMVAVLLAGGTLALGSAGFDLATVAQVEGWPRVLVTRLRALGMHPNGVGPLFASSAVLGAGAAFALRGPGRIAAAAVGLLSLAALLRTDSRASAMGFALGAVVLLAALFLRVPRRARTLPLVFGASVAVLVAVLASPLGGKVFARLDAMAWTQSALGQRWHFWRTSLAALSGHPWFGLGPNQFFLRARYAEPSYYDGTAQDLHPHQIFLAIAEGAGWPALGLFVGLVLVLVELARRSLRGQDGSAPAGIRMPLPSRAIAASLLAWAATILGANQLDLGLSQNTYAPLWLWIALGLLAAASQASPQPAARGPRPFAALVAVLLALPLVVHPTLCCAFAARAQSAFAAGRAQLAHREAARLERISPGDSRAYVIQARAAHALGRPAEVLALRLQRAERSPGRAGSWHALAQEAIAQGQLSIAQDAVVRARELDPRGLRVGDVLHLEAALGFAAGDVTGALGILRQAMELGSRALDTVPSAPIAPRDGDPPGAKRRAFLARAADGTTTLVPWTDLLDEIGGEVLATAVSDPMRSRRLLHPLLTAYASMGLYGEALAWSLRHREASASRFPSVAALEIELLGREGRWDEALALVEAGARDSTLRVGLARAELVAGNSEIDQLALAELDADIARLATTDVFYNAGQATPLLERAFELRRGAGDASAARRALLRLLREVEDAPQRQRFALAHLVAVEGAPASLAERAEALALYAAQWRLTPRALLGTGAVAERVRSYLRAGPEPVEAKVAAARETLWLRGYAERLLLQELGRRAAR